MQPKKSVIFLIGFLIILCLAFVAGFITEKRILSSDMARYKTIKNTVEFLSSGVVTALNIEGNVTKISGRMLTLSYANGTFEVPINQDAQVFSFAAPVSGTKSASKPANIQISSIKIGDSVNVGIKVLPSGAIEAMQVIVFPVAVVK